MQAGFAARLLPPAPVGDQNGDRNGGRYRLPPLSLAQACDEVLFDLKIMDETLAREQLRMNMPRVLDNFTRLVKRIFT
jgi:pyruvate-formate lyase-activating enzyme